MADIESLIRRVNQFRDARDWRQFNNAKDEAISLSLEAAEVLEHMQWRHGANLDSYLRNEGHEKFSEELMDVLYWVLAICSDHDIDIAHAFEHKMKKNEEKYPLHTSKGVASNALSSSIPQTPPPPTPPPPTSPASPSTPSSILPPSQY